MFSDSSVATVDDAETLTDAEWHDLITGEGVSAASPAGPRHQNPHWKFPRIYSYFGKHRA